MQDILHNPIQQYVRALPYSAFIARTTSKDGTDGKTVVLPQINLQLEFVANQFAMFSAEHLEGRRFMMATVVAA